MNITDDDDDERIGFDSHPVAIELAMFKKARGLVASGVPVGLCHHNMSQRRMIYWVEGCLVGLQVSQRWHVFRIWGSGAWTEEEFVKAYTVTMKPDEFHKLLKETDGI